MTALVSLVDASRHYRTGTEITRAVDGVNLVIEAGAMIGLVGPSGAGKTTLINLIVGWDRPSSGRVERTIGDDWSSLAVIPQALERQWI